MTPAGKLRVLLADDHSLFRKGLVSLISAHPGVEVAGEAEDGYAAIELARQLSPDLILMDIQMPGCDGIEAIKVIKKEMPQIRIVILSAFDDDDNLFAAIKNGADGYLLKNISPPQFFDVLEEMRSGTAPISRILADRLLKEFRRADAAAEPQDEQEKLTPIEIATLELLVDGYTNKNIADKLYLTEHTVKFHLRNIMEKLHLRNRTQLAIYALRKGLVNRPSDPVT